MKLCLASTSPRRRELLAQIGISFDCEAPGVEEIESGAPAKELAIRNARCKAESVARRHPDCLILGADTVVVLDGKHYGKPRDLDHAHQMLEELGGRWHEVLTAVCLLHCAPNFQKVKYVEFVEVSHVLLRPLTVAERDDYFAKIDPLDKAGAYAAQETGLGIVQEVRGSFSNVVGLPVERLQETLKDFFPGIL